MVERICIGVALLALLALFPHPGALASQSVDPSTLNPPPLGENITCQATGGGTICRADAAFAETDADTGISCGSFEILITDTFSADRTYRYDQANNLLEFSAHRYHPGTWSNSVTGKSIPVNEHDSFKDSLATPGDFSTGTVTFNGQFDSSTAPGIGLVFHDVGTFTVDPDGDLIREGGPHDFFDNFPGLVQAACAALA